MVSIQEYGLAVVVLNTSVRSSLVTVLSLRKLPGRCDGTVVGQMRRSRNKYFMKMIGWRIMKPSPHVSEVRIDIMVKIRGHGNFAGGPWAKTLSSRCRVPRFDLWSGN